MVFMFLILRAFKWNSFGCIYKFAQISAGLRQGKPIWTKQVNVIQCFVIIYCCVMFVRFRSLCLYSCILISFFFFGIPECKSNSIHVWESEASFQSTTFQSRCALFHTSTLPFFCVITIHLCRNFLKCNFIWLICSVILTAAVLPALARAPGAAATPVNTAMSVFPLLCTKLDFWIFNNQQLPGFCTDFSVFCNESFVNCCFPLAGALSILLSYHLLPLGLHLELSLEMLISTHFMDYLRRQWNMDVGTTIPGIL